MPMSPEQREERLALTRNAAIAMTEDLQHLREVLAREDPSRGELRRLSSILRRFLLGTDRDLSKVAAPRIGRIKLLEPDNKPVYKASRKGGLKFFASARVSAFGVLHAASMVNQGSKPLPLEGFDPDRTIEVRIDNFLSQGVLFLDGIWVSRGDVIEYMANVASGVHSGSPESAPRRKQETYALIDRIRYCVTFTGANGGVATISANWDAILGDARPVEYDPTAIDPVLVELLAAVGFIANSPDVDRLEKIVTKEVRGV